MRFENGTEEVPGLVTDFSVFGPVKDTNRWVMLLYSTSTQLPLNWKAAGVSRMSAKPGCWEPKDLRLAGVLPGQPVALSVALLETTPSAPPFDLGVQHWRTDAFPYVHDSSRPSGSAIKGFRGLGVPGFCSLRPLPEAAVVEVMENGELRFPDSPGDFSTRILVEPIPNVARAAQLGRLESLFQTGEVRYAPRANTYGDDLLYRWRQGGFCDPPRDHAMPMAVRILPSPRRPYLVASGDKTGPRFALRGLAGRRHVIQRSSNLVDWTVWKEVEGNYTEVALPDPVDEGGNASFFRVVP